MINKHINQTVGKNLFILPKFLIIKQNISLLRKYVLFLNFNIVIMLTKIYWKLMFPGRMILCLATILSALEWKTELRMQ